MKFTEEELKCLDGVQDILCDMQDMFVEFARLSKLARCYSTGVASPAVGLEQFEAWDIKRLCGVVT